MIVATIAFIRETRLLTDELIVSYIAAQQIQLDRDLLPAWSLTAKCLFVPPGDVIPAGAWQCVFLDNSDQAGALGYHDVTADGLPVLKIFVADVLADGVAWTVTASHEVIEALGDPDIRKTAVAGGFEYAWELCDAPEDDRFSVPILGHHLSNAVMPAWFDPNGKAPFTLYPCPGIAAPFQLAAGGYIGIRPWPDGAWGQRFAMGARTNRQRKGPASRTMRRFRDEKVVP
jgi:hypothetical protein